MSVSSIPIPSKFNKLQVSEWFKGLQNDICKALEHCDGKGIFEEEIWQRSGGGGGRTMVMKDGSVIEKGGVGFSEIYGSMPTRIAESFRVERDNEFFATGVSVIIHPSSPMIPIIHMNVRYFETSCGKRWFGGGIDLTPIYIDINQAKDFHKALKKICDKHHPAYYSQFKERTDDYFFIKHRNETRGIGGIFFDKLSETEDISMAALFEFVKDVGSAFIPIYTGLIEENRNEPYGEKEKAWQKLRRGRYVEFNLIYDNGTKFGLDTGGRIESILMSLPPEVNWAYNYKPGPGTREEMTQQYLKKGIDWLNL